MSLAEQLTALPPAEFDRFLASLTDFEADKLVHDWELYAREDQMLPPEDAIPGGWFVWLILAGRGFGKTRTGVEAVKEWAKHNQFVNLAGATSDDVRDIMIEGESGILAHCSKAERPIYRPSKRRLDWPNGARSLLFTGEEPDRARGKQSEKLWADELASWKYPETWDQLMLGLRLGKNPQAVATTTPRPIPLIKALLASPTTVVTRGSTYANKANLSEKFISQIITKYLGTRLGRQEIDAEVLDENPNALWTLANIEANRIQKLPQLVRIVVAIDPAATSSEEADDTGIVVAGRDDQQPPHFYVFDDQTTHDKPAGWAKKAVTAYHEHEADRIVGEINNGGEMVEHTVRTVDENVSYKSVHATRGKAIRAEPVSALYEQNRVHHVGFWPKLEDEMVQFDPSLGPNQKSPNRMDALVWAITDLADTKDGIFGYYQDRSKEAAKAKPKESNVPLPKDVRKWSEPVRILQMGIQPEITKDQWPAFHAELSDWMEAFAKDKDRVKAGEKLIEKLEKKYGKVPTASE